MSTSWTKDETEILKNNYKDINLNELCKLLPNRTKESVRGKIKKLKSGSNTQNKNTLLYIFDKYKRILSGEINRGLTNDNLYLTYLFKYYLRKNNIPTDRNYIINNFVIGEILKSAKLKTSVKKSFNGYFEFMRLCFPSYDFKEWEFKNLDVSPNFWDIERNRFQCIRMNLNRLIQLGLIQNEIEVLTLPLDALRLHFHGSLIYKYGKSVFNDYLLSSGFEYDEQEFKFLDGYSFDSKEELYVYKQIKSMGFTVVKPPKKEKLFNNKYNESYIPDFILNNSIFVEYYGLWRDSRSKFHNYNDKVKRKNQFYKENNYNFIAIYPEDLKDDCRNMRHKINNAFYKY